MEVFYRYNADGQRIFKKVGSLEAEHYIMDGDRNLAVFNDGGSLKYWNIFGNGLAGRMDASGDKFYYLKDHLGSTRAVINHTGTVVEAHDYYPFGLQMPMRSYVSDERTKELFTGKELDGETGWYYHGARFRHPALGPWLSVDPMDSKYPGWSPYNYALNNAVNYTDPDGKGPLGQHQFWYKRFENWYNTHFEYFSKHFSEALPIVFDGLAVAALVAGQPHFSAAFSAASVVFSIQNKNYTDASIGIATVILGSLSKNPRIQITAATIQLVYDLVLAGYTEEKIIQIIEAMQTGDNGDITVKPEKSNKDNKDNKSTNDENKNNEGDDEDKENTDVFKGWGAEYQESPI